VSVRAPRLAALLMALALTGAAAGAGCGAGRPAGHGAAPGEAPGAGPRVPRSELFGMNAQFILTEDPSSADPELRRMADQGIGVVRADASWEAIEPAPPSGDRHTYDWGFTDRFELALARRSLRWLPIAAYSAPWDTSATGTDLAPPVHDAEYAAFAAAIATRYGPGGAFWRAHPALPAVPVEAIELWNEENYPPYWGGHVAEPVRYLGLYLAARAAIHRAVPGVRALVGGLAEEGTPVQAAPGFLTAMARLAPGLARSLDGVAVHPYAPDATQVLARIADLRAVLVAFGAPRVPIEVTEVGWSTKGGPSGGAVVSDAQRGQFLATLADRVAAGYCGVDLFAPYTWRTLELVPTSSDFFGLEHPDGTLSAGGAGYAGALATAARHPVAPGVDEPARCRPRRRAGRGRRARHRR